MGTLRVIDVSTGEDMSSNYTLRHRNQDAAFKRKEGDFKARGTDFTAANMRNLHEVFDVLTTAQCGYLMRLQCNVSYDGGTLVNSNAAKTPMTTGDMMDVLQLKRKRSVFYNFFNACTDNGIIIEQADGTFAVNDRYHFKGAFGDKHVVKSYTAKIKRVYREVKAADIGLIYRMLPYVHYETNALCANPAEKNAQAIRWFNVSELAQVIGVKRETLARRLPAMKFDGEYVVARIKVGNEPIRFTFNPNVFYRMDSEPDATLVAMFNVSKKS